MILIIGINLFPYTLYSGRPAGVQNSIPLQTITAGGRKSRKHLTPPHPSIVTVRRAQLIECFFSERGGQTTVLHYKIHFRVRTTANHSVWGNVIGSYH